VLRCQHAKFAHVLHLHWLSELKLRFGLTPIDRRPRARREREFSTIPAMVTITDNDPVATQVSIAATDPNASEVDLGTVTLSRTGSTAAPLNVHFAVSGTAQWEDMTNWANVSANTTKITYTVHFDAPTATDISNGWQTVGATYTVAQDAPDRKETFKLKVMPSSNGEYELLNDYWLPGTNRRYAFLYPDGPAGNAAFPSAPKSTRQLIIQGVQNALNAAKPVMMSTGPNAHNANMDLTPSHVYVVTAIANDENLFDQLHRSCNIGCKHR